MGKVVKMLREELCGDMKKYSGKGHEAEEGVGVLRNRNPTVKERKRLEFLQAWGYSKVWKEE